MATLPETKAVTAARLRETDLLGGVTVPAFASVIYGIVQLVRHGAGLHVAAFTYLPLLGGVVSIVATMAHIATLKAPEGRSWALTAGAFAILLPYVFSLYLMGYLGVWAIWRAVAAHPLAWGHALAGTFWLLIGWRMLYVLGQINRRNISAI